MLCRLRWCFGHGKYTMDCKGPSHYLIFYKSFPPLGPPSYPMKVSSPYSDDYMATDTSHPPTVHPPTVPPNNDSPHTRVTPQPQPPMTSQSQPTLQSNIYPNLPGREEEEIPYYTGGQYPQPTYPQQHRVDEHTRLVYHWSDNLVTVTCPHWTECMVLEFEYACFFVNIQVYSL